MYCDNSKSSAHYVICKVGYVNWDAILTRNLTENYAHLETKIQPCNVVS